MIGSSDAQTKALIEWIEDCKNKRIEEEDICILARPNELVRAAADALQAKGYEVVVLKRRTADDRSKSGLRLGTMHRSKGLEFAAVAMVDVNDGIVPPRRALDVAADPAIRRSILDADKSLLHVSATRAKKRLFVSSSGMPSDIIAQPNLRAAAE